MMKKLSLFTLLSMTLAFGLAGCKHNGEHPNSEQPNSEQPNSEQPDSGKTPSEHPEHPR